MEYFYNLVKKLIIDEKETHMFAKPSAYKNINSSQFGKIKN